MFSLSINSSDLEDLTMESAMELLKVNQKFSQKVKQSIEKYKIKFTKVKNIRADLYIETKKEKNKREDSSNLASEKEN